MITEHLTAGPISPTLAPLAVFARISARLHADIRAALLVFEQDKFVFIHGHGLALTDEPVLDELRVLGGASALIKWSLERGVYVRPLLTDFGELLGALVFFGVELSDADPEFERKLDEICWMAVLALEQKHLPEDLMYRAHHDALTRLWNRVRMEEEIDRVLAYGQGEIGLAVIGIDRLRVINDVLGYEAGDELLCQIATRLVGSLESGFSLARSGGDEFLALMPGLASAEAVSSACTRLLQSLDEPFAVKDHQLAVRASAGATVAAIAGTSAARLQSEAATALRYAKARSRGRVSTFDPSMIKMPPERLVMEQHLRFAMQKREFGLHYQPQIEISTSRVVGLEALLRWNHPALGFISPGTFLPLAEEISVIEDLGDWVMEEALKQLAEWRTLGLGDVRLAVNVSAAQFSRANFASHVAQWIRRAGLPASNFEIEITESTLMGNLENTVRQMKMLRSLGVQLAIDDFGTGHSSLAYLATLPANRLKIDRMFVRDVKQASEPAPLLASIVQMAHALNLPVIAEGVETEAQLSVVRALGCEEVQGFFYARPMPAREVLPWIQARQLSAIALSA